MHVIAVSNQKGGCGKTTTAINLSASLASLGRRTLLVDLDPQAHATFGLGVRSENLEATLYNVLTEQEGRKKSFLENVLVPIRENLDLAPSHVLLSTIEQEFTNRDESVSQLHEILTRLSFPYEFVVIDCPPSLGFLTFNALRASEMVVVPIELGSFSLMGVSKLLSMVELIRVKLQHTPQVFALRTLVDMRTRFSKYMTEEIQKAFGKQVFTAMIHQAVVVRESQAKGVPVLTLDAKSKAAIDYLLLTQEILGKTPAAQESVQAMIEDNRKPLFSLNRIKDFMITASGAREVYLVGDFNNWQVSREALLWQKGQGVWQKRISLEPGHYRYKFVIDGRWITDPQNDHLESNPYGGLDSVMEVE